MFTVKQVTDADGTILIQDPPIARLLFQSTKASIIWLIVRLYIGYEWVEAGWHKFTDPAWMSTGDGILGFWTRALAVAPNGKPVITYDWYRSFIQFLVDSGSHPLFAKMIVFGELAVGLGLIVGALVGVAAFFGALMNISFLMAGTISINPVLFCAAILLILAWKNAGYLGIDRFLLPALGTPWRQPSPDPATARPAVTPPIARHA